MDSFQLRYGLMQLCSAPTFVCSRDQLHTIHKREFAVICNNEDSDKSGMHWCAFYKSPKSTTVEFFDSFAMPPNFYGEDFINFCRVNGTHVEISQHQIQ